MKRKADLMSILGLVLGFGLMFIGVVLSKDINTGAFSWNMINLKNFFDETSVAIVFGGTFAGLMVMFPASQLARIPKHLKIIFMPKQYVPQQYIETLVGCAKKARMNGLLALEEDTSQMTDSFMKQSIQMIVDSVDPEKVKLQMESWLASVDERHTQERSLYDKGAGLGPAFGMIGTLIGLINMMKNLSDTASVGPNMAVALITTFYGSILANIFFAPISNKLRVRHEEEFLCMQVVYEGVLSIQAGENPNMIEEKLIHMLPEYEQKKYKSSTGGEGEAAPAAKGKKGKKK